METTGGSGDHQKRTGIYRRITMFKNIISPVQAWLLSQGKCVGCGKELVRTKGKGKGQGLVACHCGRMYMYDGEADTFRRATFDEVK